MTEETDALDYSDQIMATESRRVNNEMRELIEKYGTQPGNTSFAEWMRLISQQHDIPIGFDSPVEAAPIYRKHANTVIDFLLNWASAEARDLDLMKTIGPYQNLIGVSVRTAAEADALMIWCAIYRFAQTYTMGILAFDEDSVPAKLALQYMKLYPGRAAARGWHHMEHMRDG